MRIRNTVKVGSRSADLLLIRIREIGVNPTEVEHEERWNFHLPYLFDTRYRIFSLFLSLLLGGSNLVEKSSANGAAAAEAAEAKTNNKYSEEEEGAAEDSEKNSEAEDQKETVATAARRRRPGSGRPGCAECGVCGQIIRQVRFQ